MLTRRVGDRCADAADPTRRKRWGWGLHGLEGIGGTGRGRHLSRHARYAQ